MHIAFFSDQHPGTLGGLQVSLGLQRKYLEARGHTVTVCAPDSKRVPSPEYSRRGDVLLRAAQVGEHSFTLAGTRFDYMIDASFASKPPVDVVHIQADVWGAWNGYRFAARHGLPVIHTMHTNLEVGLPAMLPFPRLAFRMMFAAQRRFLDTPPIRNIAEYTAAFADRADLVVAPSRHFADRLNGHGTNRHIQVLPTGVDDALITVLRTGRAVSHHRPILVCPGRVSREKHLGDLLRAFAAADLNAEIHVYGAGNDLARCRNLALAYGISDRVSFFGAVSHMTALKAIRDADAVVQTSVGYETQGLTVYEAAAFGTSVILRDRNIATDLPDELRHPAADATIESLTHALTAFVHTRPRDGARRMGHPTDRFHQSGLAVQAEALYRLVLTRRTRSAEQALSGERYDD